MACATRLPSSLDVVPSTPSISLSSSRDVSIDSTTTSNEVAAMDDDLLSEAAHLASLYKSAITTILESPVRPDRLSHADKAAMLALPLLTPAHRVADAVAALPRRKSARGSLAVVLAGLLFPTEAGSLSALIRYEEDRKRIRDYVTLQRQFDAACHAQRHEDMPTWDARIRRQGRWNPSAEELEMLKKGVPALPMPVRVPDRREFEPFLEWVAAGGTHELPGTAATAAAVVVVVGDDGNKEEEEMPELDSDSDSSASSSDDHEKVARKTLTGPVLLGNGEGEDYYHTPGLEFRRGVLYEDARLDLCKQVVGPDHIGALMQSLRTNTFVRHFLLGNNIIGPVGARAIGDFIHDFPNRMDTWYLAGNCIDGAGFKVLVDAMVKSTSVTNIWLKRNPLGAGSAKDLARLITQCQNLRTLDLDQTELGDGGAAELFGLLAGYQPEEGEALSLCNLYLNGIGISTRAAAALGKFLASPAGALVESIYMSCNPLGDAGAVALAEYLPRAKSLKRLVIQSIGLGADGAIALCTALGRHQSLSVLDLGQAYATADLGAGYNYITDEAASAMVSLVRDCKSLQYFNLGRCALSFNGLACVMQAAAGSESLLVWQGISLVKDAISPIVSPALSYPLNTATIFGADGMNQVSQANMHVLESDIRLRLERNVRARFGEDKSYSSFWENEKRWVLSDQLDVRKIDSVYRTRDVRKARRGEMVLVKLWEDDDDTLDRVMGQVTSKPGLEGVKVSGPVCPLKKLRLEQQKALMAHA